MYIDKIIVPDQDNPRTLAGRQNGWSGLQDSRQTDRGGKFRRSPVGKVYRNQRKQQKPISRSRYSRPLPGKSPVIREGLKVEQSAF